MPDNVIANPGSGGATFATDDIGGVQFPRTKLALGGDGVYEGDVGSTLPLPVSLASVPSHPVTNAGTFAVQAGQAGTWSVGVTAAVGAPAFVRLSDGTSAINTLPVSVASVPAHDVTNAGTFAVQAAQTGIWTVGLSAAQTLATVTNLAQLGGQTIAMGTGVRTAGTQRVTIATDDVVPASQNGTWTVGLSAAQTLATVTTVATVTNLSQLGGQAIAMGTGVRTAGTQRVTIATDDVVPASQSGTWTVGLSASQTLATVTTVSTVSTLTGGGVAHDSVDSGNPIKIGGRAVAGLSGATLVAAADRTDLVTDTGGQLLVRKTPLEDIVTGVLANTDGASTSVIAAQGAGVKTYITDVTIANSSATNVTVDLRDGTAGSVKWTFPVPANGGVTHRFETPLPFSANTAVAADASAAATTITISLGGFKSKI
jgi:hypothetical protein